MKHDYAATFGRNRNVAAATVGQKDAANALRNNDPKPQDTEGNRENVCGWRLWQYVSSFLPPRSLAGASHSIHRNAHIRSL